MIIGSVETGENGWGIIKVVCILDDKVAAKLFWGKKGGTLHSCPKPSVSLDQKMRNFGRKNEGMDALNGKQQFRLQALVIWIWGQIQPVEARMASRQP